jgi:phage gp45-like
MNDGQPRFFGPLLNALDNLVARAVIRLVSAAGATQQLQAELSAGEVKNDLDLLEGYGLTAQPLPGAIAVCLFVGGERENGAAILAHDQAKRPRTLAPGDVALYTDQDDPAAAAADAQHRLHFGRDRSVILRAKRLDIQCGTQRLILDETEGLLVQASQIRFEEL